MIKKLTYINDQLHLPPNLEINYTSTEKKKGFFSPFFTKLAGTTQLQEQIEKGYSYREIRKTWLAGLEVYDLMKGKYLLYKN